MLVLARNKYLPDVSYRSRGLGPGAPIRFYILTFSFSARSSSYSRVVDHDHDDPLTTSSPSTVVLPCFLHSWNLVVLVTNLSKPYARMSLRSFLYHISFTFFNFTTDKFALGLPSSVPRSVPFSSPWYLTHRPSVQTPQTQV